MKEFNNKKIYYKIISLPYYIIFSFIILLKLKLLEYLSPEQIKYFQVKRLRKIIIHAYENVPYYKKLFDKHNISHVDIKTIEDLKKIPIITKDDLRDNSADFISDIEQEKFGIIYLFTSGSTGIPLKIALDLKEFLYSRILLLYGYLKSGVRIFDKIAIIHVSKNKGRKRIYEYLGLLRWRHINMQDGVEDNIRTINYLKPDIIVGFPSYLVLLSKYIFENKIKITRPKIIFSQGEVLVPKARIIIERGFSAKVKETYGSIEFHRIAFECKFNKLHIMDDAVIVETDGDRNEEDGSEGLIITSLYHKTMPFIRYKIGDKVILSNENCRCGLRTKIITKIIGREDDYLTLPDGKKVSARAIDTFESTPGLMEFQIIQREKNQIDILVRTNDLFSKSSEDTIKKLISEGFPGEDIRINIIKTDKLTRGLTGKLRVVIQG